MKEVSENNMATLEGDLLNLHQKLFNIFATESGMGKSEFENVIHDLLDEFVKVAKERNAEVTNYYDHCTLFVTNVMSALIMNKHFDRDHPFCKKMNEFISIFLDVSDNFSFMSGPLVKVYANLKYNFLKDLKKCKQEYFDEIQKIIEERLQTFDDSNCRCMLDFYLKEQKGINGKHFDMETIKGTIVQLFFGGTLTTAFDLYSTLQQMALNASIQKKVYKEIENVIGDGVVKYSDITRMPYTHATISESQRFSNAVPITGIHVTTE
ncbi:cytochrome P450 2U1-like protein [Leptotrombidium deliense]|uniref:Cytochrome P450 2U1-like protein n=1 Tax=Leptotrombidium deliense TaxID=299467 RepID=A0A443SAX8_9ACAR|nr:cytochrome P450 2U1-like protein [Leptotrombidium deliense]